MGDVLAILAAVTFALGVVLQQKGTLSTEAGEDDPRFLLEILHEPVWLAGTLFQVFGWILQAMALDRASLVVTQSLISLSLVIALPLGVWLTNQHIGRREIAGAPFTLTASLCSWVPVNLRVAPIIRGRRHGGWRGRQRSRWS